MFSYIISLSCFLQGRAHELGCSLSVSSRHILIVIAVAYGSTLVAYLDANYEIPYSLPELQFWPCDRWAVGLPHIVLKSPVKTQKRC